jgi:phosphate transport system protein
VAKRLPAIAAALPTPADADLIAIGRMALGEVVDAMKSYELRDADLALELCARDVALDRYYSTYSEKMLEAMDTGRRKARVGVFQLYAARNFERIGDQATNIAERVHFAVRGRLPEEERPRFIESAA